MVRSSLGSQMWDVVVGGAQVVGTTLGAPVLRSRYNEWGATAAEVASPMPGDELVPSPRLGYTRAISISAAPAEVWASLVLVAADGSGTRLLARQRLTYPDNMSVMRAS